MTLTPAEEFWGTLQGHGMTFASGVPCSYLSALLHVAQTNPRIRYVPAVREDVALGVASAASLVGPPGVVIMQNSGLGNVTNGLTSFNLLYRIPVLLVISWRGQNGKDAPEHFIMGRKLLPLLDLLEVPYDVLAADGVGATTERAIAALSRGWPAAVIVPQGVMQ